MAAKKQHESHTDALKQPKIEPAKARAAPPVSAARMRMGTQRPEAPESPPRPRAAPRVAHVAAVDPTSEPLSQLLAFLLAQMHYDFRCYPAVFARRVARRMEICRIAGAADYLEFVRANPDEVTQLSTALLAGTGGFFRDREAFKALEEQVIPELLAAKGEGELVRAWVPGCATGEEAYSIAILLTEGIEAAHKSSRFRIFASDIDESMLQIARRGTYLQGAVADVAPGRLTRFFTQEGKRSYRITKSLGESVLFAAQNLVYHAPFSKLDLISCRNLLVYFEPEAQRKILALLHLALNEGAYLMLGPSESIGDQLDLFEPISKKWRIYRRIGVTRRCIVDFPIFSAARPPTPLPLVAPLPESASGPADMNEVLQSVREELAMSREELQSLHEELLTVSGEMEARIQERTAQLEAANRDLQADISARMALEREVLGIAAEEQRRIGQELHDGMGQELTGLGLMAQNLVEVLADKSLPEVKTAAWIAEGLGRALGQIRWLSKGLIPAEVDGRRLRAVLAELTARTGEVNGTSCSFQCDEPFEVLDNATATHLARIAQEALTNALKHGHAKHIVVSLESRGSSLALKILDDGVGIVDPGEESQGVGLRIMHHRANLIGADLSVGPVHGGGTLVTCTLIRERRDA